MIGFRDQHCRAGRNWRLKVPDLFTGWDLPRFPLPRYSFHQIPAIVSATQRVLNQFFHHVFLDVKVPSEIVTRICQSGFFNFQKGSIRQAPPRSRGLTALLCQMELWWFIGPNVPGSSCFWICLSILFAFVHYLAGWFSCLTDRFLCLMGRF